MERNTFDRFTRLFAGAGTRRDALRLVATGAILGGAATLNTVAAKPRRKRGKLRAEQASLAPCPGLGKDCNNKKIGPGVNLSGCGFSPPRDFFQANFSGANLSGASFFLSSFFNFPSFRGANATNVCFGQADLELSDFRSANVRGTNFCGADLRGADFRGSNVTAEQLACAFVGCTTLLPNGKPAVVCDADQICCGGACCTPDQCEDDTCIEPPED